MSKVGEEDHKSILKNNLSGNQAKESFRHETDFQTVLPGHPRGYFVGLLPTCPLGPLFPTAGFAAYDYGQQESFSLETPYKDSEWHPTAPDPIYVHSMPWTAYPYGVPAQNLKINRAPRATPAESISQSVASAEDTQIDA